MAGETMNPAECGLKEQKQKRYVDINPAIEFLEGYDNSWGQEFADGVRFAVRYIKKLAVAEEQGVRHGEWHAKQRGYDQYDRFVCSICGEDTEDKSPYCPWCGAKNEWGD